MTPIAMVGVFLFKICASLSPRLRKAKQFMKKEVVDELIDTVKEVAKSDECKAFMKFVTGTVATILSRKAVSIATTHPVGAVAVVAVGIGAVVYTAITHKD